MDDLNEVAAELGVYDDLPITQDDEGFITSLAGVSILPHNLARCHEYLADAVAAVAVGDRDYRAWRASMTNAILEGEPRLAQAKVDARINSDHQFNTFKTKLAERHRRVETLRGYALSIAAQVSLTTSLLSE